MSDNMIRLTLPDGSVKEFPKGTTGYEAAKSIGERLANDALAVTMNGALIDVNAPLMTDADFAIITPKSEVAVSILRHSTAHLMAHAVQELRPGTKFGVGPVIEDGFYYDMEVPGGLTDEDLPKIEEKMKEIAGRKLPVERAEHSRDELLSIFKEDPYKCELIRELPAGEPLTTYKQGDWMDLCRGPHAPNTGRLKVFKLLKIAGAYWRGDEKNPMLTRVYGTAFADKDQLKEFLRLREEAEKRDHRRLGKELDLFSIQEEAGGGLVFWHPKGAFIRQTMEQFWREEHYKNGYELVYSPHIAKAHLWETSGHLGFYKETMFNGMEVEGQEYLIKPMNCPFHILMYKSRTRSYRDLPLRWAELGTVYRYERSGVLHGLLRVRGFTQDDAHLYMREDQLQDEIKRTLEFVFFILRTFGFMEYEIYLSTRPEKRVGEDRVWDLAETALAEAMKAMELRFEVDEGGGAFYGPKIDIKIKDALGRAWQCSTLQVDFSLPERFEMHYVSDDGSLKRPIMIHRALMGSIERFFGCLVEHYGGAFPMWLAPVQAEIIPITDRSIEYAEALAEKMRATGLRAHVDERKEKMNYKIREAQLQKIPYMLVVGDREAQEGNVSLRHRSQGDLGVKSVEDVIAQLVEEAEKKVIQ